MRLLTGHPTETGGCSGRKPDKRRRLIAYHTRKTDVANVQLLQPLIPTASVGILVYSGLMPPKPLPLSVVALVNLHESGMSKLKSIHKAAAVCASLWQITYTWQKLGHYPTQAEYADEWKVSERSVQREWALFKQAFPGEESPERLARWMLSEINRRIEDSSTALTVTAPPDLVLA